MRGRRSFHCPVLLKAWLSIMMISSFSFWIMYSQSSLLVSDPHAAVLLLETSRNAGNATELQSGRFIPYDSIPVFYNVYTRGLNATYVQTSKSIVDEPVLVKLAYTALPNVGTTLPVPEFPAQAVVHVIVRVGTDT